MNESISYCIRHDILKDVLLKNRSEVRHMLLTEFDEKKFAKSMWKEGHESGYTEDMTQAIPKAANQFWKFWMRSTEEMIP